MKDLIRLIKKSTILALAFLIFFTSIPMEGINFALLNAGDDIYVDNIKFVKEHNGYTVVSAYIEITGSGLQGATVRFEKTGVGGGYQIMGTKTDDEDGFLKYVFTAEEALSLAGSLRIGNKNISLNIGNFPTLSSVDKEKVNVDSGDNLVLTGTNLDSIKLNSGDTSKVKAEYGRVLSKEFYYNASGTDTSNQLTLVSPTPPENNGYQNILFSREVTNDSGTPADPSDDYSTVVKYLYANGFRFIESVGLQNIEMFPNVGNAGDLVYFDADEIVDTKEYAVFFLKELDATDKFSDSNKAEFIAVENNITGRDRLIVKVPNIATGNYRVYITNTLNGEVVAEQLVKDGANDALYTVVQSSTSPKITKVAPSEGPDSGADVQLDVSNLLTLALPDLVVPSTSTLSYTGLDSDKSLKIDYGFNVGAGYIYKYRNKEVIVSRTIKTIIGNQTTFVRRTDGSFVATKGNPDTVQVNTGIFTDADVSPNKDIKIEVITTLVEATNGVADPSGKTYTFKQEATKLSGYTVIPSTLTPILDEMVPDKIQIKTVDNTLQNEIQFVIKGGNFIVDRYIDGEGKLILKYPTILFKQNGGNTLTDEYQVGFFPNVVSGSAIGLIKWKTQDDSLTENILMDSGSPVGFNIEVLDDNDNVVDGTDGNSVGTKIILTMPESTYFSNTGVKSVQVINVRRGSDFFGFSSVAKDAIEILKTTDIPVIESVIPNIVTVDGGDEIVVRGSNFQDGVRLFLAGDEITNFTREIDPQGDKILLKFKAPSGREGATQILVINPSGGSDVYTFIYVKTFAKDPVFDSFSPLQGTEDTYVVVNGDNFLKPDPTATSFNGYEGFRLLGTRVYLDGKDVNTYNTDSTGGIVFKEYTAPDEDKFISVSSNLIALSKFYKNVSILDGSGKKYYLENDKENNPRITDHESQSYAIKYVGGIFKAYDESDSYIADVTITDSLGTDVNYPVDGITIINIGGADPKSFTVYMNNNILLTSKSNATTEVAKISDYADSIILSDGNSFFTLTEDLLGNIKISNGKDIIYTITYDNLNDKFIAKETEISLPKDVTITDSTMSFGSLSLKMYTPYKFDDVTRRITGDRTKVITKDQIAFYVPKLTTGKGYKDIKVVNPDTKSAAKTGTNGFYYVTQSTSHPVITEITPDKGSVDGGFNITIKGSDFEDNAKVYIDSVQVPLTDTYVSIDGESIVIKVPKSIKNLREDYNVDRFTVPILVINDDGGNAYRERGFTYIIPVSSPTITKVIPTTGSSNGGEIVEIFGYEFRFYEPYTDTIGGSGYDIGDPFTDLYVNSTWDDLLSSSVDPNAVTKVTDASVKVFGYYYDSEILPTVYFGEKEAKIVEYGKGYLKVIAPSHESGTVNLYVVNNDLGITNKISYSYKSSTPKLTTITPNKGKKSGQERKELYGSNLYGAQIKGYYNDNATAIVDITDVQSIVRFGNIDNLDSVLGDEDYGQINNQIASVPVLGGLKVEYRGSTDQLIFTHEENGRIYTRTFSGYDDSEVFVPMEMLMSNGTYYVPNGLRGYDGSSYTNSVFEYVKVYIKDKRLMVERGYAPKVTYDNQGHVTLTSPSYYTIDPVDVTYYNTDGGKATITFTYTNPDSIPQILKVEPAKLSADNTYYMVEGSTQGGIELEVIGLDFRSNVKVSIGSKSATIVDLTEKEIDGKIYDVIIVKVPVGSATDIDKKQSVIVENTDAGLASSSTLDNLIGPNYGSTTIPFYFIYRKPLSIPTINTVSPEATSVYGGNQIVITGTDFRAGAVVIIGAKGGVPVTNITIENSGSIIKFNTPKGLTLGDKTIQVINSDFGLASKEKGLKIVSAPTVEDGVENEAGTGTISRISIEGGQKIRVKGTGFAKNAKVVFGGTRTVKNTDTTGEFGLYIDDKYYSLENGVLATSVEYIDSQTLLVTTPQIKKEEDITITVINEDTGISDSDVTVKYTEPIPSDPIGLKVQIIDNRYVELYGYSSDTVEYYEIYYYLGNKSAETLYANKYNDFKYLDVTDLEPYKVKDIPGYENRGKTDRLYFLLKAVNKFGPSNYSNLAYLDAKILNDVKEIGPVDEDGGLGVPDTKDYTEKTKSDTVQINLSKKAREDVFISLTKYPADKFPIREVLVPKERVTSDNSLITVDYGDSKMQFMPLNLSTKEFKELYDDGTNYGRLANQILDNSYSSMAKGAIPRGMKAVTQVYQLDFGAMNGSTYKKLTSLNGNLDIEIRYSDAMVGSYKESTLALYYFDSKNWVKVSSTINTSSNKVTARVNKPGMYILLVSNR